MAITADVYGHPDEEALKEAARKMGTVLGEGEGDGRERAPCNRECAPCNRAGLGWVAETTSEGMP